MGELKMKNKRGFNITIDGAGHIVPQPQVGAFDEILTAGALGDLDLEMLDILDPLDPLAPETPETPETPELEAPAENFLIQAAQNLRRAANPVGRLLDQHRNIINH